MNVSPSPFVVVSREGAVTLLTMNRPANRNSLSDKDAVDSLVDACAVIAADTTVRAVVITGTDPAFSAGGNLKTLRDAFGGSGVRAHTVRRNYRDGIQRIPQALYNLEVPTIAAVNGPAMGAGCDLACMCDIRIASVTAKFAISFVKLGLVPGDGGAWFLPRIVGMARALELSLTGDEFDASQAHEYGLVSRVVPHERLLEEALALASRIATNPAPAVRLTKRLLRESGHQQMGNALEFAAAFQALAQGVPNMREALAAVLEKRLATYLSD